MARLLAAGRLTPANAAQAQVPGCCRVRVHAPLPPVRFTTADTDPVPQAVHFTEEVDLPLNGSPVELVSMTVALSPPEVFSEALS